MGDPLVKTKTQKATEQIQVSLNNIHDITNIINQKDEFCRREELITVSMNNFKNAALEVTQYYICKAYIFYRKL